MIFLIHKRHLLAAGLLCCFLAGMGVVLWKGNAAYTAAFAQRQEGVPVTVILDPGHGGEDGGAVSADGCAESRINLDIALRIEDLLRFCGENTAMTRREEVSVATEGDTIRARKVSDIHNRVAMVNDTENAVLVSIHQNSLPSSPETHGAQVFWNPQPGAEDWANCVQEPLNTAINTHRAKQAKAISSSIYLMQNVTAPAILVECGFLSNPEETRLLQEPSHQRKLAVAITAGCLQWGVAEEAP